MNYKEESMSLKTLGKAVLTIQVAMFRLPINFFHGLNAYSYIQKFLSQMMICGLITKKTAVDRLTPRRISRTFRRALSIPVIIAMP